MFKRLLLVLALAAYALPLCAQSAKAPQVIVIEGRREASDASISRKSMIYFPFDVPEGVTSIELRDEFKHQAREGERLSLDHAYFDPRGHEFPGRGWRGNPSPGAVTLLTGDHATTTPRLVPGPIPPGRWQLMQWLRDCPKSGVTYKYTITLSFDGPAPPREMPEPPPYDPGVLNPRSGWYPGELHSHTIYSDGVKSLEELVARAKEQGLSFLVNTDHNAFRAQYDFAAVGRKYPDILVIPGMEWTTLTGHANIIGPRMGEWFNYWVDPGDGNLPKVIDSVHTSGALFSINHYYAACWGCEWKFPEPDWQAADALEVWNGKWGGSDARALEVWDGLVRSGRHINAFGGTDYHRGDGLWGPTAWVYARNLSHEALMEGLRKGRVFLSANIKAPKIFLSIHGTNAFPGDTVAPEMDGSLSVEVRVLRGKGMTLRLIWPESEVKLPVERDYAVFSHTVRTGTLKPSWVRTEIILPDGRMAALTNPIYVRTP